MELNSTHRYQLFWSIGDYRIISCESCGFNHVYPFPNLEQIKSSYQDTYYEEIKPVNDENIRSDSYNEMDEKIKECAVYIDIYNHVTKMLKTNVHGMMEIGSG